MIFACTCTCKHILFSKSLNPVYLLLNSVYKKLITESLYYINITRAKTVVNEEVQN